jgi:hypothetical protein
MFINVKDVKVRIADIQYGTDKNSVTWGTANVNVFEPLTGWINFGKVTANVKTKLNDTFNEEKGKKLVFNVLQRKALNLFKKQIKRVEKTLIKELSETSQIIEGLNNIESSLEDEFETIIL